jgi:hypothetical protein
VLPGALSVDFGSVTGLREPGQYRDAEQNEQNAHSVLNAEIGRKAHSVHYEDIERNRDAWPGGG